MLKLVFAQVGMGPTKELGPFKEVRLSGETLLGDGKPIAEHKEHCWYIGEQKYFRIDCSKSVMAHFENGKGRRSPELGPFLRFSSADGIAYGDGDNFAHIDPREGVWYWRAGDSQWKELVVRPE